MNIKSNSVNYLKLVFFIVSSGSILFLSGEDDITLHILCICFLGIGAIYIVKGDLFHPYVWYSSVYIIYSISYPLLHLIESTIDYGYSKELLVLQWLGLSVFLVFVTPAKTEYKFTNFKIKTSMVNNRLLDIIIIILIVATYFISKGNFTHKQDIYSSNNIFYYIVFRLAIVLVVVYIFRLVSSFLENEKINAFLIIKVGCSIGM